MFSFCLQKNTNRQNRSWYTVLDEDFCVLSFLLLSLEVKAALGAFCFLTIKLIETAQHVV